MCGLFGIAGPGIQDEDYTFIKSVAYVSALRGMDASGVAQGGSYQHRNSWFIEKLGIDISSFLVHHMYGEGGNRQLFSDTTDNWLIGHVRAATRGKLIKENAHPFEKETIIGVHNGTLKEEKYKDKDNVKTDSELLFDEIDTRGVFPVLKELDEASAYAIVVYDKDTGELIFARSKHRELWCCWHKKRKVFYWASERWMLTILGARMGMELCDPQKFTEKVIHKIHPQKVNNDRAPNWRIEFLEEKAEDENKSLPLFRNVPERPKGEPIGARPRNAEIIKLKPVIQKKKKVDRFKDLYNTCSNCGEEHNLLKQLRGKKLSGNIYICSECITLMDQLTEIGHKKVNE